MNKLRDMVKKIESNHTNQKNYYLVSQEHRHLPINSFKKYHRRTRISAAYNIVTSCLRLKKVVKVHCDSFEAPPFLTQEEWNSSGEFEAILNCTSKLTIIFQNEEKLNGEWGPVIRKLLHDGLSFETMKLENADDWSSKKLMLHPTRSEINASTFTTAGRACLSRALLKTERFFLETLQRKLLKNQVKIVT